MSIESKLDTLEPRHLEENEEGALTQVPNVDRFDSDESGGHFSETGQVLKQHAAKIADKAKTGVERKADGYINKTSTHFRDAETVARDAAGKLREGQPEYVADSVDYITDRIGDAANYLESKNVGDILEDGRQVVRKYPALVLGGLLIAGFAAGRYLKSTGPG